MKKKAPAAAAKKKAAAPARKKVVAAKKKAPAATKKAPAKKPATRADLGAPIDGFFAKQPPALRPLLDELRALIEELVPGATSSLKWGMPFFEIKGEAVCAVGAHKKHVNLILAGPPGTYADPDGLLSGDGKTGRHLKMRSLDDLPREAVRGWLRTAAKRSRP